jgi:23S rRNA pseudouridine1911/1915/1917 synthase
MRNTLLKKPGTIISSESTAADPEDVLDSGPDTEWRELTAADAHHGARLDKALAEALPEFSRSYLQQLIEDGAVTVNGRAQTKASLRLRAGDTCRIGLRPTPQSSAFKPETMKLDIVFADAQVLVINKPAGLVVHPAPGNWGGTLLNGLLAYDNTFADLPRAGIVHRLDKDTSGLMLVARTRQSMDALVNMIAERRVQRQYLALAHRAWSGPPAREIQSVIGRDPTNRLRMAVVEPGRHAGKPARTTVEFLDGNAVTCLVRCTLHTGRTHQIRVHMASMGHPLVADLTYGGSVLGTALSRQALHAYHLGLLHPVTGAALDFVSLPPDDLGAELSRQGLRYNF